MNEAINPTIGSAFEEIEESSLKAIYLNSRYSDITDQFLDAISDFKEIVEEKIQLIKVVNKQLEKLTWIEISSNPQTLQKVSSILHICKGMYCEFDLDLDSMVKHKIEPVCPEIVSKFRFNLEILEECIRDVKMIFFELRTDNKFNDLDKRISMLK